jgi:hypothetical protein
MNYRLYISYRDICWHEKIVIGSSTNILELYNEIKLTHVYETHWDEHHHHHFGEFPYKTDSPIFPSFAYFKQVAESLSIGDMKYVMRSKKDNCSYYCGLKRLA